MGPYVTGHMFKDSFPSFFDVFCWTHLLAASQIWARWSLWQNSSLFQNRGNLIGIQLQNFGQRYWMLPQGQHSLTLACIFFTPLNFVKRPWHLVKMSTSNLQNPSKSFTLCEKSMRLFRSHGLQAQSVLYQIFDLVSQPSTRLAVVVRKPGDGSVVMVETGAWQKNAQFMYQKDANKYDSAYWAWLLWLQWLGFV